VRRVERALLRRCRVRRVRYVACDRVKCLWDSTTGKTEWSQTYSSSWLDPIDGPQDATRTVWNLICELCFRQQLQRQTSVSVRRGTELDRRTASRIAGRDVNEYSLLWKTKPDHVYSRHQIGITAKQNKLVALVSIRVIEHKNRDVHVGPFLFLCVVVTVAGVPACRNSAFQRLPFELTQHDIDDWRRG
jgi:hypothetical protein